jgi:hypothetical protein
MKNVAQTPPNTVKVFYESLTGLPKIATTADRTANHVGMSKVERGQEHTFVLVDKKSGWQLLPYFENDFSSYKKVYDTKEPIGLSPDGKTLYFTQTTSHGTRGLYTYNLETLEPGEEIASDSKYDLFPISNYPANVGGVYFSSKDNRFLGYSSNRILDTNTWIDPLFAGIQTALDKVLPKQYINSILDWSFDETKFVIYSFSDSDFGAYYLFDTDKKSLDLIGKQSPTIKKEHCGKELVLHIPLRDGQTMLSYLRLPSGVENPKNLSCVINFPSEIHNRFAWGNSIGQQAYSTHGIATLLLNTRGSVGFGRAYFEDGFIEGGSKVVEDMEDAIAFLIKKKILNPDAIAIEGSSLSSLYALKVFANNPQTFQAGLFYNPISDWKDYENSTAKRNRRALRWSYIEEATNATSSKANHFDLNPLLKKITKPVHIFSKRGGISYTSDTSTFPSRYAFYSDKYAIELDNKLNALGKDSHISRFESVLEDYDENRMKSTILKYKTIINFLKEQFEAAN